MLVRANILRPRGWAWDLSEVKSATRVKDHYDVFA
jgi:hypothetical protein